MKMFEDKMQYMEVELLYLSPQRRAESVADTVFEIEKTPDGETIVGLEERVKERGKGID
jgi:hypothetical protein